MKTLLLITTLLFSTFTFSQSDTVTQEQSTEEWFTDFAILQIALTEFPQATISEIETIRNKSFVNGVLDVELFFHSLIEKYEPHLNNKKPLQDISEFSISK